MTPEHWQQVKEILAAALEHEPAKRGAYLDQACTEPALRREVESLIEAHEQGEGSFIDHPAVHTSTVKSGTKLGDYEIVVLLGAGGMGEVYQAHDSKLRRDVAIKVLPAAFAHDPERLSRFQREARMLASLNHPNIATIHGLEHSDGVNYLVMELVPGQTLAERVSRGPVPLKEALTIAGQIAEALETAHEKGVIHRDLKPANVKVTSEGKVKVLDFGLAKAFSNDGGLDLSHSPTLTGMASEEGRILGTPAYMSPEQARGKPVDKRTDIWAFGCLLYELLTGKQTFRGETLTDTLAAILEREPDWQALPAATPTKIRDLLRRCMEKDTRHRLRDLGDARLEIEEALTTRLNPKEVHVLRPEQRKAAILKTFFRTAAVALIALLAAAGWLYRSSGQHETIDSLVVLPFVNASADPNTEYFSDGITETLINSLSQLPNLRVMSRDSAFRYKGKDADAQTIGRELRVRAVFKGRVIQRGDTLAISTELVDARDNSHIWGQQYSRSASDIFALQAEIAREVTTALRLRLTGEEEKRIAKSYTASPEAYRLYLQGRYHGNKGTEQELKESVEYYKQALAQDSNYALAYAGLADAYSGFSDFYLAPRQVMPEAEAAVINALKIDNTLSAAHASLAFIKVIYDWDWAGAEKEAREAIELNPNSADAHSTYAYYLARVGRTSEFEAEVRRAEELDPLSVFAYRAGEVGYLLAHQYRRAAEQGQKGIEVQPDYPFFHSWLGVIYAQMGRLPDAVAEGEKGAQLTDSPLIHAFLGYTYAAAGKTAEARKIAEELAAAREQRYVCGYEVGTIHLTLGDKDEAFRWYEKAYDERSVCVPLMKFDPRLNGVHADPRYRDLIRRIGFPEQIASDANGPG